MASITKSLSPGVVLDPKRLSGHHHRDIVHLVQESLHALDLGLETLPNDLLGDTATHPNQQEHERERALSRLRHTQDHEL